MEFLGLSEEVLAGHQLPSGQTTQAKHAADVAKAVSAIEQMQAARKAAAKKPGKLSKEEAALARAEKNLATAQQRLAEAAEPDEQAAAAAQLAKAETALANAQLLHAWSTRDLLDPDARDAFYASLTDEQKKLILRRDSAAATKAATAALDAAAKPEFTSGRDMSVYSAGQIEIPDGEGTKTVEGRLLDGDMAIVRTGYGAFLLYQRLDGRWLTVGSASSKTEALKKAERIPKTVSMPALADGASEFEQQARAKWADAQLATLRDAASASAKTSDMSAWTSGSPELAQRFDKVTKTAARDIVGDVSHGPILAEIDEGTSRHRKRELEAKAVAAGVSARDKTLASGGTAEDAQKAYQQAYQRSFGTPTLGGGYIPHFGYDVHTPAPSLGKERHAACHRSGIRPYGVETAKDYAVIAARAGADAPSRWGFKKASNGHIATSSIDNLVAAHKAYLAAKIDAAERKSITVYTGGSYREINAAITGRNPNPTNVAKTHRHRLLSMFSKLSDNPPAKDPMTLMRGTQVPSAWKGTREEYLHSVFPVGSRMQMGKCTSTSTRVETALSFSGYGDRSYLMAIRTRSGLAVKSISQHSSEDEALVGPPQDYRCVHIDMNGIGGRPTVYLVEESLAAEADQGIAA